MKGFRWRGLSPPTGRSDVFFRVALLPLRDVYVDNVGRLTNFG